MFRAANWRRFRSFAVWVSVSTLSPYLAGAAADEPDATWPQFHGPQRDNISRETGLLKKWPDDGPTMIWTAKGLGFGYASVSIAGGRMFTAGNIDGRTVISALDLKGKLLWQVDNGAAWEKSYSGKNGTCRCSTRISCSRSIATAACSSARWWRAP